MIFFIDTSNKYVIFSIIINNKVEYFKKIETNKDTAKNTVKWMNYFFKKNKLKYESISKYYFTVGPGSFTGTKVALNIINSLRLVFPKSESYFINTFDLISNPEYKYTIINAGKSRYYIKKKHLFSKAKVVNDLSKYDSNSYWIGYDNFNKEVLQQKINEEAFIKVKNPNDVKIIYLGAYYGK